MVELPKRAFTSYGELRCRGQYSICYILTLD